MAAKGYVVLYPNPRGTTSYGQDFGNIIQYKYPGDDYKDLMVGVDEMLKKGYIDQKKLGVTGGSGGGLLTDWTVGPHASFRGGSGAARHRRLGRRGGTPPTSRSSSRTGSRRRRSTTFRTTSIARPSPTSRTSIRR